MSGEKSMCGAQLRDDPRLCTLAMGHDGPHENRRFGSMVLGWWNDANEGPAPAPRLLTDEMVVEAMAACSDDSDPDERTNFARAVLDADIAKPVPVVVRMQRVARALGVVPGQDSTTADVDQEKARTK